MFAEWMNEYLSVTNQVIEIVWPSVGDCRGVASPSIIYYLMPCSEITAYDIPAIVLWQGSNN